MLTAVLETLHRYLQERLKSITMDSQFIAIYKKYYTAQHNVGEMSIKIVSI